MAIGGVNSGAGNVLAAERAAGLAIERTAAEARRADANQPNEASNAESKNREAPVGAERQQFVLGASAYRRVLSTLESERGGETPPRVLRDGDGSFTSQRAQRAYQDASSDGERESMARLFGVDVFA